MDNNKMKSNKTLLYVLVLLIVLGLACQAVSDPIDESLGRGSTPESATTEPSTPEPGVELTAVQSTTEETPVGGETTDFPPLDDVIERFEGISQAHEEEPVYFDRDVPPPGGVHAPAWQNCGVYASPVETKNALHSLEHGAVWLTYNPDLPQEDVMALQELAKNQAYTVLSPFPDLRSPVVMVAWGIRFETDNVTDPRILEFLLLYQQGPQTPEPGAPCQGGLGAPLAPDSVGFSSS
jgi:hypothetical protein